MATEKITEEGFRDDLSDLVVILERLSPYYSTTEELLDSCKLATDNEIHLRLVFGLMMSKGKK